MGRSMSGDWHSPGGGESGYIAIKPDDPDIVVASGPTGQRAYNDHMTLYKPSQRAALDHHRLA